MQVELKEQAKTSKLNNSSSIYIPGEIIEKFNWKKGKTEFDVLIDFLTQTIAFKRKQN